MMNKGLEVIEAQEAQDQKWSFPKFRGAFKGLYEPYSKLLKGGYIGDYIGDYYRGY